MFDLAGNGTRSTRIPCILTDVLEARHISVQKRDVAHSGSAWGLMGPGCAYDTPSMMQSACATSAVLGAHTSSHPPGAGSQIRPRVTHSESTVMYTLSLVAIDVVEQHCRDFCDGDNGKRPERSINRL